MTDKIKDTLKKPDSSFFTGIGFPLVIVCIVSYYLSYGYVGYKLWNWFILPLINSGGKPTIGYMIGLFIFVKLFTMKLDLKGYLDSKSEEEIGLITVVTFIAPWLSLFVGYLVKFLLL